MWRKACLTHNLASNLSRNLAHNLAHNLALSMAHILAHIVAHNLAYNLAQNLAHKCSFVVCAHNNRLCGLDRIPEWLGCQLPAETAGGSFSVLVVLSNTGNHAEQTRSGRSTFWAVQHRMSCRVCVERHSEHDKTPPHLFTPVTPRCSPGRVERTCWVQVRKSLSVCPRV